MKKKLMFLFLLLAGLPGLAAQSNSFPQFFQDRDKDWARLRWSSQEGYFVGVSSYLLGDFDGDGRLDLLTANRLLGIYSKGTGKNLTTYTKDTFLLKGDGEGFFELKSPWTPTFPPNRFAYGSCLAKGDFDGDGDLDLFVGKSNGTLLRKDQPFPDGLLINNGKGVLVDEASKRLPKNSDITSACLAIDVDRDGDLDLIVGLSPGKHHVYINNGKGYFKDEGKTRLPQFLSSFSIGAIRAGDVDGDGDVDLVLANGSMLARFLNEQNFILLNNGKGFFTRSPKGLPWVDATNDVALGDVDGDGDLDLVTANWNYGNHLFINDGKGGFKDETTLRWKPKKQKTNWIVMGDVDQDGDQDIIFGGSFDCRSVWNRYCDIPWRLYLNDGKGFFREGKLHSNQRYQDPRNSGPPYLGDRALLMDEDRDGDLDLFVGESRYSWLLDVHFNLRLHLMVDPRDWKRGEEREVTCYRTPGFGMFLVYGSFRKARLPIPGIGLWAIDPSLMFSLGRVFVRPGKGKASLKLRMPLDSSLRDKEIFMQALFVDGQNGSKHPLLRTNRTRNRIK